MFCEHEQKFSIYMSPHQGFLILKNWSNKVNDIYSNFKNMTSHVESCSHENDYNHKNGIVTRHILLHD
jgi:hypothetical protein